MFYHVDWGTEISLLQQKKRMKQFTEMLLYKTWGKITKQSQVSTAVLDAYISIFTSGIIGNLVVPTYIIISISVCVSVFSQLPK